MDNKRVFVVAAHPDDEVLGCGGVMAKHVLAGDEVYVLILGEGLTSRGKAHKKQLEDIKADAKGAAGEIGVKGIFFEAFPDNSFDSVPMLDIAKAVERLKKKISPSIVYTHYVGDLNVDHRVTHQAVLTAFRPIPGETVEDIYSFEVPSSTEWEDGLKSIFRPNVFVDISDTLDHKKRALECYKTEMRNWPHPRSSKGMEILSQKRGTEVGLECAEAFMLIRSKRRDF